jgi:hypothetical protein
MPMISKFVGFYGSNGFLCQDINERLVLYESEYENTMDLQVYGKHDSIRAVRYRESLVLLQKGSQRSNECFSCKLVLDPLPTWNE